jgi:hypothetical protein
MHSCLTYRNFVTGKCIPCVQIKFAYMTQLCTWNGPYIHVAPRLHIYPRFVYRVTQRSYIWNDYDNV